MKLFKVMRTDDVGDWEYGCFVVAAKDEKSALEWTPIGKPDEYDDYSYQWTTKEYLKVEHIGESNSLVEKVIISSFNAG